MISVCMMHRHDYINYKIIHTILDKNLIQVKNILQYLHTVDVQVEQIGMMIVVEKDHVQFPM